MSNLFVALLGLCVSFTVCIQLPVFLNACIIPIMRWLGLALGAQGVYPPFFCPHFSLRKRYTATDSTGIEFKFPDPADPELHECQPTEASHLYAVLLQQ